MMLMLKKKMVEDENKAKAAYTVKKKFKEKLASLKLKSGFP